MQVLKVVPNYEHLVTCETTRQLLERVRGAFLVFGHYFKLYSYSTKSGAFSCVTLSTSFYRSIM